MTSRNIALVIALMLFAICGRTQVVYGTLTESGSQNPIEGAVLMFDDTASTAITGRDGEFRFEGLGPGLHTVVVSHLQYKSVYREIQLSSAQDYQLDIQLDRTFVQLPEATVTDMRFIRENALYTITPEEITRFPGTFFDPARFALSFPGVQIVNDQANEIVINGMAPELMKWRLEGLEIVNPNHLANAGTISDRPTSTGGGVQMLSNLVLANSSLLIGAMPTYGNATSGIMDMHFRNGNTSDAQHSVQVGLLGLEGMTEGPFKKGGKSSYLINGRYSTVGLLSAVGVDFGDEQIQFGDLSANVNLHLGDRTVLKVFGLFGANSNKFDAKEISEWEEDKDRRNIDFASSTYVAGASFRQGISSDALLTAKIAYSRREYDRTENILDSAGVAAPFSNDKGEQSKLSFDLAYATPVSGQFDLTIGLNGVLDSYDSEIEFDETNELFFIDSRSNENVRPYLTLRGALSARLRFNAGVGYSYYGNSGTWNFEPQVELDYQFNPRQQIAAGYRLSSQSMDRFAFAQAEQPGIPGDVSNNLELAPVRGHHAYVNYQGVLGRGIFEVSARYVRLFDVPSDVLEQDFSPLNRNPFQTYRDLSSEGSGRNVSLSFGYRKNFEKDWFFTGNVSFVTSRYQGNDGNERSTTYDLGYVGYVATGKEWLKQKERGLRTWGANAAVIVNGGMREPDIDVDLSESMKRTAYVPGTQGMNRLDDYFRIDVRAYWRMDKTNTSSTISLDIQNLLGRENAFFSNYDLLYGEIREGTQLGLIPVLNWRLDF